MLAHSAVCAEESRADLADGEVLPAKPNTYKTFEPSSIRWKWAYRQRLSLMSLKVSLRGLMQLLVDHSDPLGRVWVGQTQLARWAECSVRTLRRYFVRLEAAGLLRREKHSFKSLTAAQKGLGLPVPYRNDEGRAPDLLTLLFGGELAFSYVYPSRPGPRVAEAESVKLSRDKPSAPMARTVPEVKTVPGEPRTKTVARPPDKLSDDLIGSAYLTRKVEGDSGGPRPILVVETSERKNVAAPNNLSPPVDLGVWRTLTTAYDAQFRRVYLATPRRKPVSSDEVQAMTTHLVEVAEHLEKRLSEQGVVLESLAKPPLHMLVDEVLRSWFASPGTNEFLLRVGHRIHELAKDLPYRAREAVDTLVRRIAPPLAFAREHEIPDVGRRVVHDKPPPMKLSMPAFRSMGSMMQRPSLRAEHETDGVHAEKPGFGATIQSADAGDDGGGT